jgi:hypothetical protein
VDVGRRRVHHLRRHDGADVRHRVSERDRLQRATWNAGCVSTICGTASDTGGSDLQKVEVSIRRGSGNYWNGSAFASASQVWNLAAARRAGSYGFPGRELPADGRTRCPRARRTHALNVQSPVTTQTFTIDTTARVDRCVDDRRDDRHEPDGFVRQGGGYVVYADVSDVNGVSSATADVSGARDRPDVGPSGELRQRLHRRRPSRTCTRALR